MSDRCAVLTTLNGEIIEWRVFDSHQAAMQYYNAGVGKLQEMLRHTDEESVWEIMLCDVKQYALSRQNGEHLDTRESSDWYSKYLTVMAGKARRIKGVTQSVRQKCSLQMLRKVKKGVGNMFNDEDEPTMGGL